MTDEIEVTEEMTLAGDKAYESFTMREKRGDYRTTHERFSAVYRAMEKARREQESYRQNNWGAFG